MIEIVNQSAERILENNPLKRIELAGRTCYKSEDKISENSHLKFCDMLLKNGHRAMLEFGSVVFLISDPNLLYTIFKGGRIPKYFNCTEFKNHIGCYVISCNLRALIELDNRYLLAVVYESLPEMRSFIQSVFQMSECGLKYELPQEVSIYIEAFYSVEDLIETFNIKYVNSYSVSTLNAEEIEGLRLYHTYFTVKTVTDRAIANEFVRHRTLSFAQESTRYCNYSKEKYGSTLRFVPPYFFSNEGAYDDWECFCENSANLYLKYLNMGETPQKARDVLPLSLATSLCVSGTLRDWGNFFDLRLYETTGKAHPKMKQLANLIFGFLYGYEMYLIENYKLLS